MLERLRRRFRSRFGPALLSDRAFLEQAYRDVLGRDIDEDGYRYYAEALRNGESRLAVILSLTRSDEYTRRLVHAERGAEDIRGVRPAQYLVDEDMQARAAVPVFQVLNAEDYDWLEAMILENGYYEQPGVWNFAIDTDKRVMAEMLASFAPRRALELGCASGAVLACLRERGVDCEGVEISALALEEAVPEVRERIHQGDLLKLDLPARYDLVFGLDVFEHLNPNRIDEYLRRLAEVCTDDGWVFANIPAFGADPVFGTVFPQYLRGWMKEAGPGGRLFSRLHVDERGYPLHGHLVWADSAWWVGRFAEQGFLREPEVEQALHAKYDEYMDHRSRARKAYFVFSRGRDPRRRREIAERVRSTASRVLA